MQNIGPFINLGWHTVPLRGELKRREDGTKTEPVFEKGWRQKYKEIQNTVQSKLGGTMTGSCSGIIAIDCDNDVTYELFKSLDPEYDFVFLSKGKLNKDGTEKLCGTIIYEYTTEVPDCFSINDGVLALDIYSNNGFVYLPTVANETKVPFEGRLPKLKEMPVSTRVLLQQLKKTHKEVQTPTTRTNVITANCLAPLVRQFVDGRKFLPGLFRVLTPRDFRDEPQYRQEGYLHPENVPEGRGSEYLSKVSAILGADISIDEELYISAMHDINELWPQPMDADRLDATITDRMVNGQASVNGVAIWQYEEDWDSYRLILQTKRQSSIELGYDDKRAMYYIVDVANENIQTPKTDAEFMSYVSSVAVSAPTKAELKSAIPLINVEAHPDKPFGFFAGSDPTARTLNTFIRTPELCIIQDPESYEKFYRRPHTTLKYFETLVPETGMREYLLKFLKRKLSTFEYSPVTLYFLGKPGTGKDTFVQIIEKIMGLVAKPSAKEFLESYNAWLLDTYFVQLDEYGDQLVTMRDREEAFGKFKAYTGKRNVQIRAMRTDGFQYLHHATFICTANKNPFGLEDGDRRIALFNTPTPLVEADWVEDVVETHQQIMAEVKDFCYYLATEVGDLSGTEYMIPPTSASKQTLIADSMYASQKLAYVLKHGMLDYLKDLATDHSCEEVKRAIAAKKIKTTDLEELYSLMTDFKGDAKSLNKAIRQAGIEIKATTTNYEKDYYYVLSCWEGGPFHEEDV